MKTYQVAVFQPNGILTFWDSKEFNTREEAGSHLTHLQTLYNTHMAVVQR
jgi:hypothetical protein